MVIGKKEQTILARLNVLYQNLSGDAEEDHDTCLDK